MTIAGSADPTIRDRRCSPAALHDYSAAILAAIGAPGDVAELVAAHLVRAHLSGHDSHGVLRLPTYLHNLEVGRLVPDARPQWLRDDGSTGLMDAQRAFGQYALREAVDWAVPRAREHGVTIVAVRHSSHTGRLGDFVEQAAAAGMVAQLNVGMAGPGVGLTVPFGGARRCLGSNPWAIAIPVRGRPPVVMDSAMSVTAAGKVMLAAQRGTSVPEGTVVDPSGQPTTDPDQLAAGGGLVPLGGDLAGHKGSGLALVGALLGSLAMIGDEDPLLLGPGDPDPKVGWLGGVLLTVLDPERFGSLDLYSERARTVLEAIELMDGRPGHSGPRVPGTRAAASREVRRIEGIPVPDGTWQQLVELGERFSVTLPPVMDDDDEG